MLEARHHNPFEVLGRHLAGDRAAVRAFLPNARDVRIAGPDLPMTRIEGTDLFVWEGTAVPILERCELAWPVLTYGGWPATAASPRWC